MAEVHELAGPDPDGDTCRLGSHSFRITIIRPDDAAQVLVLFNRVFGHSADSAWYGWKSCNGALRGVGLWNESGELVAHYAGLPRILLHKGRPLHTVQICDVMVAPDVRGLLTRRGPFFQVCRRFFDLWVGPAKDFQLAYGFPNLRHLELGEKLGLYHVIEDIPQLTWKAQSRPLSWRWRWSEISAQDHRFNDMVKTVWNRMEGESGDCIIGRRDIEYLRWRFVSRPDRSYRWFCLRHWWGGAAAAVVMRFATDGVELLDLIGARSCLPVAVRAANNEAAAFGASVLTAWASHTAAEVIGGDAQHTLSGARLGIARASVLSAESARASKWWLVGGDSDFR